MVQLSDQNCTSGVRAAPLKGAEDCFAIPLREIVRYRRYLDVMIEPYEVHEEVSAR
jgi:hypothetical protein